MLKKMKAIAVLLYLVSVFAVLSMATSCSNNHLANTTWQDDDGNRTITFTESTFRWRREDNGFDERGTYTVSKEVVVLTYDRNNATVSDTNTQTGSLINGVLSFTAGLEPRGDSATVTRINVEFHRVK